MRVFSIEYLASRRKSTIENRYATHDKHVPLALRETVNITSAPPSSSYYRRRKNNTAGKMWINDTIIII